LGGEMSSQLDLPTRQKIFLGVKCEKQSEIPTETVMHAYPSREDEFQSYVIKLAVIPM
jgi:hypothetical protein